MHWFMKSKVWKPLFQITILLPFSCNQIFRRSQSLRINNQPRAGEEDSQCCWMEVGWAEEDCPSFLLPPINQTQWKAESKGAQARQPRDQPTRENEAGTDGKPAKSPRLRSGLLVLAVPLLALRLQMPLRLLGKN